MGCVFMVVDYYTNTHIRNEWLSDGIHTYAPWVPGERGKQTSRPINQRGVCLRSELRLNQNLALKGLAAFISIN